MALLNAPTGREAMRTFLKTVTDDIVDPSADLMTLMAAGFGRLQAAFEASNTFVVAEGGRYETIQSAVDAAVAIFLDIANLFINLLRIFGGRGGRD